MIDAGKILRLRGGDDAALFQEDDAGGEEQGFAKIVSDEDDGFLEPASEGTELALKFRARNRIKGTKGLVH